MVKKTSWVFTTIFYQFCWLLCGPCDQVFQCIGRERPPFANETRDFGAWTLDDAEMKEKPHKTQKQLCKKSSRSGYPFTKGTGIHRFLSFRPFTIVFVTLEHRYRYARGWTHRTFFVVIFIQHHNWFSWISQKTTYSKRNNSAWVFDFLRIFCLNNHGCLSLHDTAPYYVESAQTSLSMCSLKVVDSSLSPHVFRAVTECVGQKHNDWNNEILVPRVLWEKPCAWTVQVTRRFGTTRAIKEQAQEWKQWNRNLL